MFEIRSYHYEPEKYDAYKKWAVDLAVPCLKDLLDVRGFWLDNGRAPEVTGANPSPGKHGVANVTWIIHWESDEERDAGMKALGENEKWQAVWAQHPDPSGYLQMEARFTEEV